jgi:hypothetical protein
MTSLPESDGSEERELQSAKKKSVLLPVLGCAVLVLGVLGIAAYILVSNAIPTRPELTSSETITQALKWGNLAPIPAGAKAITAETEGNAFTLGCRVSFTLDDHALATWIAASPGFRGVKPEKLSAKSRRYVLKPTGGAQYAEVTVTGSGPAVVEIYAYWS